MLAVLIVGDGPPLSRGLCDASRGVGVFDVLPVRPSESDGIVDCL